MFITAAKSPIDVVAEWKKDKAVGNRNIVEADTKTPQDRDKCSWSTRKEATPQFSLQLRY